MTEEFLLANRRRIGARIAELRKEKGLSMAQLADLTGLKPPNINRIEKGLYSTGLDLLTKISSALGKEIKID